MQVWAVPPKEMQCEWLGERVATVDVDRAITNVIHNKEDAGWGPNAVFRFPLEGGTGGIWKGVARLLPQDKQVAILLVRPGHSCSVKLPLRFSCLLPELCVSAYMYNLTNFGCHCGNSGVATVCCNLQPSLQ